MQTIGPYWYSSATPTIKVYNSYNLGTVNGKDVGGIVGYVFHQIECINSFSTGNLTGTNVGGIVGSALWNNTANIFKNCYYKQSDTVTKGGSQKITVDAIGLTEITTNETSIINTYIDSDPDSKGTAEWLKWNVDESGNPIFIEK